MLKYTWRAGLGAVLLFSLLLSFLPLTGATPHSLAQDPSPTPALTECPLADGVLKIAWIPKALDNPVFELGRIGAETRAAELTESGPCVVEVMPVAPLRTTADEQAQLIRDVIELGDIDAIGVSCIDPEACVEPINEAIEAGIPVMTWDSDSPDSDRLTYLGIDNFEGGQAAALLLVREMGESGQVALLSGVEGSLNLEQRVEGFMDVVDDYPDIEVVDIAYSDDLPTKGVEEVERIMDEHPDLDGWFFVGLWPLLAGRGAMPTWEAATQDGDLVNIVFDTLPFQLDFMKDGFVQGLVGQKYWGWGYDTVQMLYDHVLLDVEYESFTNSGMDIVTLENVDAMLAAWETNNFTEALPPPFEDFDFFAELESLSEDSQDGDAAADEDDAAGDEPQETEQPGDDASNSG